MVERLELLLRTKNLSASQLADETGIQRSIMSHVMNGRNKASLDFIMRVLNKYKDVNPDWLLFGKGPMIRDNTLFDQSQAEESESLKKENRELKDQINQLNKKIYELNEEKNSQAEQDTTDKENKAAPHRSSDSKNIIADSDNKVPHASANAEIETIVILLKDGTFREYHKNSQM